MLSKILNLTGSTKLSRDQQLSIKGGTNYCLNPITEVCFDRGDHCPEFQCQWM